MVSCSPRKSEKKKHSTEDNYRIVLTTCEIKTSEGLDGNSYIMSTK
jgi:hypothetical protein